MVASDARRKTAHRTAPHCMGARRNARTTRARACTRVRGPCAKPVKRRLYASLGRAAGGLSTHLLGGLPRENLQWAENNTRKGASTRPRMCARTQAHAHAHKHTHIATLTRAHIGTCADALACTQVNWRAQLNWRAHVHAQVRERTSSRTIEQTNTHARTRTQSSTSTGAGKHARNHTSGQARTHAHERVRPTHRAHSHAQARTPMKPGARTRIRCTHRASPNQKCTL